MVVGIVADGDDVFGWHDRCRHAADVFRKRQLRMLSEDATTGQRLVGGGERNCDPLPTHVSQKRNTALRTKLVTFEQ